MPELTAVLNTDAIARRVTDVARQISADYQDGDLVIVGVLKGALIFMADLIRQLTLNTFAIDFVRVASYGDGQETSGEVRVIYDVETDICGKDVLIVEDIVDTGLTLDKLCRHLKKRRPRTIKICTLIDKAERRRIDLKPHYVCHHIESGFLVGYGLDYAETYRNLPEIYNLKL
jgi:hypoxanthine phosphoribosyltransferase